MKTGNGRPIERLNMKEDLAKVKKIVGSYPYLLFVTLFLSVLLLVSLSGPAQSDEKNSKESFTPVLIVIEGGTGPAEEIGLHLSQKLVRNDFGVTVGITPYSHKKELTGFESLVMDPTLRLALAAWRYFEENTESSTGLVYSSILIDGNHIYKHPMTTIWDIASSLLGIVSAERLGIISSKEGVHRITRILDFLRTCKLYQNKYPNFDYDITTAQKSLDNQTGFILRTVIRDDYLVRRLCLIKDGPEGCCYLFLFIIYRYDHR